jgi:tartrate dehydratase beta subunit/fumarate hydratase class I family protein
MESGIFGEQKPQTKAECKKTKCCHCVYRTGAGCLDSERLNRVMTLGY